VLSTRKNILAFHLLKRNVP